MLRWLNKLAIPDKRYQLAHYYYAWYNRNYIVPPKPHGIVLRKLESMFFQLETKFHRSTYGKNSWFSYNWLLQRLLSLNNLDHDKQFVKCVKCRKRNQRYSDMYDLLTSAGNGEANPDALQECRKPLDESLDGVNRSPHYLDLLAFLSHSEGNRPRNLVFAT